MLEFRGLRGMSTTHRIIGFDFGHKRIGIATGNLLTKTTQSLSTIKVKNGHPNWVRIKQIIQEWKPNRLVVGLPLSMGGIESEMSVSARKFGQQLQNLTGIEVVFVDERLSSYEADTIIRKISHADKPISKRCIQYRDNIAAELILHTYIDGQSDYINQIPEIKLLIDKVADQISQFNLYAPLLIGIDTGGLWVMDQIQKRFRFPH